LRRHSQNATATYQSIVVGFSEATPLADPDPTVQAAIRHRRTLESELNRARRRKDAETVTDLITQLVKLDEWLATRPAPPS
jgi:hypothetical protein